MNHAVGQPPDETKPGTGPSDGGLRQYADWWMWARETLRGPYPRLRAAARAGMNAQSGGAVLDSAIATALQAVDDGSDRRTPDEELAQRYAELYARAHLALRLHPDAAHELAAQSVTIWKPGANISTVVGARMNVQALVGAALAGVGVVCLAFAAVIGIFAYGQAALISDATWLFDALDAAFLAFVFGIVALPVGSVAKARIDYTGERGGGLATASLIVGCLLALEAPLAGIVVLVPLLFGALVA